MSLTAALIASGVISALGGLANSGISAWAQKDQQAFNSAEAAKQRQWEEQMSNTAYQRQMADMMSAGVNPNLVNGLGASTPQGVAASGSAAAHGSFDTSHIFSSAISAMIAKKQIDSRELLAQMNHVNARELAQYKFEAQQQLQAQRKADFQNYEKAKHRNRLAEELIKRGIY